MAETLRTIDEIIAAVADEPPGNITAQEIRDALFTAVPTGRSVSKIVAAAGASLREQVNADYVCDGTADEVQIQAAIDDVEALGGGEVKLTAGAFEIDSTVLTLAANVRLVGAGMRATVLHQNIWTSRLLGAGGEIGATDLTTLTANALPGDQTLTLSSTSSITSSDYLQLGSDAIYSDPPDDGVNAVDLTVRRGEVVRVASVDSGTQVTLYGFVRDTYNTSDSASVRMLTFVEGVGVRDLSIINSDPGAHGSAAMMLQFAYCKGWSVENVYLQGADSHGVNVRTSIDGRIHGLICEDFSDDVVNSRFGYGVGIARDVENLVISDCIFRRVRHGVTTLGAANERGIPRNILVVGCLASECTHAAFDTHVQGDGITFLGCRAQNCPAPGFHLRSPNTHVIGCSTDWCATGVFVQRCAHGSTVKGSTFRHIVRVGTEGGTEGYGARINRAARVVVEGNEINGTERQAIFVGGHADGTPTPTIRNNRIINPNQDATGRAAYEETTGVSGSVIDGNEIRAYASGSAEVLSTGAITDAISIVSTNTGYEITGNKVKGQSGQIIDLNGATPGYIDNNRDLAIPAPGYPRDALMASAQGLAAQNFDRQGINGNSALVDGTVYYAGLAIPAGTRVSNIVVSVGIAGSSITTAEVALINKDGTRLAVSGNVNSDFESAGPTQIALSAAHDVEVSDFYYAAIFCTGGTMPQVARANIGASGQTAPVGSAARPAAAQTGQSSIPSTASFGNTAISLWAGVN